MSNTHVILAGDSNALGYLNNGLAPYTPTHQVQIWSKQADGSYGWNFMNPGVNTGTDNNPQAWGAEVQFANQWLSNAQWGDILWIVKDDQTVKGSTTLAVEWNPEDGAMFAKTAAAADAARESLDGTAFQFDTYDAALVVLGTNDAVNPEHAANYWDNLREFNEAARFEWNVDKMVESRIEDTMGTPEDNFAVRLAQWGEDQIDPNLTTFKTIGFGLDDDQIHYDAQGQVQLGQGFYDAWLAC